ncbi:unnamed protein product [Closterium sp. Naga37s-1]|nr:unnamed protein product [Closterium sp. Naga37s-1]
MAEPWLAAAAAVEAVKDRGSQWRVGRGSRQVGMGEKSETVENVCLLSRHPSPPANPFFPPVSFIYIPLSHPILNPPSSSLSIAPTITPSALPSLFHMFLPTTMPNTPRHPIHLIVPCPSSHHAMPLPTSPHARANCLSLSRILHLCPPSPPHLLPHHLTIAIAPSGTTSPSLPHHPIFPSMPLSPSSPAHIFAPLYSLHLPPTSARAARSSRFALEAWRRPAFFPYMDSPTNAPTKTAPPSFLTWTHRLTPLPHSLNPHLLIPHLLLRHGLPSLCRGRTVRPHSSTVEAADVAEVRERLQAKLGEAGLLGASWRCLRSDEQRKEEPISSPFLALHPRLPCAASWDHFALVSQAPGANGRWAQRQGEGGASRGRSETQQVWEGVASGGGQEREEGRGIQQQQGGTRMRAAVVAQMVAWVCPAQLLSTTVSSVSHIRLTRQEHGEGGSAWNRPASAHSGGGGGMVGSSVDCSHSISEVMGQRSLDSSGSGVCCRDRAACPVRNGLTALKEGKAAQGADHPPAFVQILSTPHPRPFSSSPFRSPFLPFFPSIPFPSVPFPSVPFPSPPIFFSFLTFSSRILPTTPFLSSPFSPSSLPSHLQLLHSPDSAPSVPRSSSPSSPHAFHLSASHSHNSIVPSSARHHPPIYTSTIPLKQQHHSHGTFRQHLSHLPHYLLPAIPLSLPLHPPHTPTTRPHSSPLQLPPSPPVWMVDGGRREGTEREGQRGRDRDVGTEREG